MVRKGKRIAGEAAPTREQARANTLQRIEDENDAPNRALEQSFTTYARSWLTRNAKRLSPTTHEVYGYWLNAIDESGLGRLKIRDITDRVLRNWKNSQELANSTLRNRCRFINQILIDAGSESRLEVPSKKEHSRRPLRPTEVEIFKKKLEQADDKLKLALILCWKVGLRRSEACGLRHEDREGDGITLRRAAVLLKGKIYVKEKGKSEKSLGWIPLPPELKPIIGKGKGYVLGHGNTPMNPRVLYGDMKRLIGDTPLAQVKYLALHALRRTYGRTLLDVGVDVVTAAKMMRHDPQMLLNEYAKTREDLMLDAVKKAFGTEDENSFEHPQNGSTDS